MIMRNAGLLSAVVCKQEVNPLNLAKIYIPKLYIQEPHPNGMTIRVITGDRRFVVGGSKGA